jgi:hypothetical protein
MLQTAGGVFRVEGWLRATGDEEGKAGDGKDGFSHGIISRVSQQGMKFRTGRVEFFIGTADALATIFFGGQ